MIESAAMKRRFPKALAVGDAVAVVAPASGGVAAAALQRGLERFRDWGLAPTLMPGCHSELDWPEGCPVAAPDADRCRDLQAALDDPRYRAVVCLRGGYGMARLLPDLDLASLARDPKPILGYSDITALLAAAFAATGTVGFHGPMLAPTEDLDPGEAGWELQRRLLTETGQPVPLPVAETSRGLVPGSAEGPLVGGNLCLLQSLIGTPWEIDVSGCLLFLEDTGEAPYRVDRMLTHLLQTGALARASGVILGDFHVSGTPLASAPAAMLAVLEERLGGLGIPVARGFPVGHLPGSWTLPHGVRARLEVPELAAPASLELLEPAVC